MNSIKTKIIDGYPFVEYRGNVLNEEEMTHQSAHFLKRMNERRTVRDFSDRPVPKIVIENIIQTASTAPSGAHKQPWTFCAVSDNSIKKQIRIEAEKEEYESYHGRMSDEWLQDLQPFQTVWKKPFLYIAPCILVVFK